MTKDEALRLALEALENITSVSICEATHHAKKDRHLLCEDCPNEVRHLKAITAIKAALEVKDEFVQTIPNFDQLQQIVNNLELCLTRDSKHEFLRVWIRDWTEHKLSKHTPPQRKPLTDEEIEAISKEHIAVGTRSFQEFARRIEAAHGIKGEA